MKIRTPVILLCLLLFCALLTAAVTAATETKNISNMDELKAALEFDGDLNLNVTREIVVSNSLYKLGGTYITLGSGKKLLNLAGYKVEVNATGAGSFDFIRIPAGAELVVTDTSEKETGKLWADGDMLFRDYGGLPYYYNSDVRYRNTIVVDGGTFTLMGGEIEAGRAKEVWVYNGQKVEKWSHQLNYAFQFGVLGWAIGIRFDGNAYQLVCGDAVTLKDGEVNVNGGKLTGKGYRKFGTEFDPSAFQVYFLGYNSDYGSTRRCAALYATGGKVTISGGQIYGMANANALELSKDVDLTLNAGTFKTQLLSKIMLPNFGDGGAGNYETNQFVADYSSYEDSYINRYCAGAGNLGVSVDYLDGNYFAWYDGNPIEKEQWSNKKFRNTASGEGHTLRLARNTVDSTFAVVIHALSEPETVASADLTGTMAQGMTLTRDTVKCSSSKVGSVDTLWYRNNELITGAHEVRFGDYFANVTVYAAKGYKFSADTKFTLLGDAPLMVNTSSDGAYAVLWSNLYRFDCDHSYNEDTSVHYDEAGHYQQCTVCGAKIAYEKHTMDGGSAFGSITTYNCTACGYAYDKENGRVKLNGLVVDIPVALAGDTIPTPELVEEFAGVAKITSFEFTSASGAKLNPGDAYTDGDTVTAVVRAKANDGYYFDPRARMNCAATTLTACDVGDDVIISTYKITVYTRYAATVTLPTLAPGMTMGEYLDQVEAKVGVKDSGNIQFTISTHGKDDEVYVRKTLSGGWQLVRGADSLAAFQNTKIKPETAYDLSFDFSTDGVYVSEGDIRCVSPASYAGVRYEGGENWFSVSAVAVSDSNKVTDVCLVGVMTPLAGSAPETDFEVLNTAALEPGTGKWNADGNFDYDTEYTFTATAKLKDGYNFASDVTASVNGIAARVSVSGNTATVKYTFPATEQNAVPVETSTIRTVELTLATPKVGEKPSFDAAVPTGAKYAVKSVSWFCDEDGASLKNSDTYEKKTYILEVFLTPAEGCAFADDAELSGILNGAPAQLRRIENGNAILTKYFTPGGDNPFTDVKESDYYYDAVIWSIYTEPQITYGITKTEFGPNATVTRGQTVTFLWRAVGCPEPKAAVNPFVDVKAEEYWYKAVLWAVENDIIYGTDKTHFSPNQTCSTAHIITLLYRTLGIGKDGWYEVAAAWAKGAGLLDGVKLEVSPGVNCPRADIVLYLYRALAK